MLRPIQIVSLVLLLAIPAAGCGDKTNAGADSGSAATSSKPAPKASTPGTSTAEAKPAPPPPPEKKLAELIVGSWTYESVEMPGTPEATKKLVEAEMKNSKVEFKDGKFTSYEKGKVFSSSEYTVEREEGRKITIKLTKQGKSETYELTDDDTVVMTDKELGKVVLKRMK
ncbi:MAG: hypothetical protein U0414_40065 [Polyangiaceae bacterium]